MIWPLVPFRESFFFIKITGSGSDGSNDIILKFLSRPGAEPIEYQTHTHTEYGYYNIDKNQYFDRGVVLRNEPQIEDRICIFFLNLCTEYLLTTGAFIISITIAIVRLV
jgi:hypothetical protein